MDYSQHHRGENTEVGIVILLRIAKKIASRTNICTKTVETHEQRTAMVY